MTGPGGAAAAVSIRPATAAEIRPLRAEVLRDGDMLAATWAGDEESQHLAALIGDRVIGCLSLLAEDCPDLPGEPAWRLRGMAVAGEWRGNGVGAVLLTQADVMAAAAGVRLLWCNARTSALGFYRAGGWQIVGEEFLTGPGIPHFRALRDLRAQSSPAAR